MEHDEIEDDPPSAGKRPRSSRRERPSLEFGGAWEYAPAPESTDHVRLAKRYGLFIGGKFVAPQSKQVLRHDQSGDRGEARRGRRGRRGRRRRRGARRRGGVSQALVEAAPAERGKYLYRIARLIQEKARELAILETMDGGKPIKESRDVDVPLAAAHFFYYAGWADKLDYAFPGRTRRGRSASAGRSFRGTSRSSWRRGRSRRRSRAATPSCSSPPRRRRSPRCISRRSSRRRTCRPAS